MSGTKASEPRKQSSNFNAASTNRNVDTWLYWLLWNLVYHAGEIDSKEDLEKTADAFLPKSLDGNKTVEDFLKGLESFATDHNSEDRSMRAGSFVEKYSSTLRVRDSVKIKADPSLSDAIQQARTFSENDLKGNPRTWTLAQKVSYTNQMAEKYGLDGTMLVMQIRQESGFRNDAGSVKGALGIAQFTRDTGRTYGLMTYDDFTNPAKSIEAMARHMRNLTNKYGSQEVALAAYNGGEGAVKNVMNKLGKTDITVNDLIDYWGERRARFGTAATHAWHVETYDYVTRIVGKTLAASNHSLSETVPTKQADANSTLSKTFDGSTTGVSPVAITAKNQDTSTKQPPTLTLGG